MIDIKNRRECFFDNFLINEEETTAERRMHKPQRREVIFELNMPWEGEHASMFTVFYAEGKWHMYYCIQKKPKSICYATSNDALHWDRPSLGRVEFNGSTDNNLLFSEEDLKQFEFVGFDNMSVFYDENPACPPSEKYKMVAWWTGHAALVLLTSPDPINFGNHRMITDDGEFDSQNRAFYSPEHGKYFCYYRGEHKPGDDIGAADRSYTDRVASQLFDPERFAMREPGAGTESFMRDVRVIESTDFVNWSTQERIKTTGNDYQLYNNVIFPYPRAPHILIGLPMRYVERKAWTKNYEELCGKEDRLRRIKTLARFGLAVTDSLFMVSRDGHSFTKYDEAIVSPPPENPEAFVYGDSSITPALIEIPSRLPGADNEYMIMVRESFRIQGTSPKITSYVSRLDGFMSMHAGAAPRRTVTKEFIYDGTELYANIETSAHGYAYFTLTSDGKEYTSVEVFGNSTDKRIRFDDDSTVASLSGKPVTLTVEMSDCELYSIRFGS